MDLMEQIQQGNMAHAIAKEKELVALREFAMECTHFAEAWARSKPASWQAEFAQRRAVQAWALADSAALAAKGAE